MVRQYQKLLAMEDVELTFTADGLLALAREAVKRGTGARALRSILENLMLDVMFEVPGKDKGGTITIDASVVEGKSKPHVLEAKSSKEAAA